MRVLLRGRDENLFREKKEQLEPEPADFGSKFENALFPLEKVFERGLRGSIYRLDSSPPPPLAPLSLPG